MAASTTRLSITCFRGYPETSCEKRSRSSKTSVAFTASPTTRPACFGPTGKFCNIYTRLARRSAKQEKRGKMSMPPSKEITRRSFLKLGFTSISASALVFVAGCGGGGGGNERRKKKK